MVYVNEILDPQWS